MNIFGLPVLVNDDLFNMMVELIGLYPSLVGIYGEELDRRATLKEKDLRGWVDSIDVEAKDGGAWPSCRCVRSCAHCKPLFLIKNNEQEQYVALRRNELLKFDYLLTEKDKKMIAETMLKHYNESVWLKSDSTESE